MFLVKKKFVSKKNFGPKIWGPKTFYLVQGEILICIMSDCLVK